MCRIVSASPAIIDALVLRPPLVQGTRPGKSLAIDFRNGSISSILCCLRYVRLACRFGNFSSAVNGVHTEMFLAPQSWPCARIGTPSAADLRMRSSVVMAAAFQPAENLARSSLLLHRKGLAPSTPFPSTPDISSPHVPTVPSHASF